MNTMMTRKSATTDHATRIDEYGGEYSLDGKVLYHFHGTDTAADVYYVWEGCETIGRMAFKNSRLREIILPDSIKVVRDQAFFGCLLLRRLNIPQSLVVFEMEHSPFPQSLECLSGGNDHYRN